MGKRMPPGTSLYSRLDAVVERQGLCVAIIAENQNITYLALRTAIDNCAATLAARGLRRGQSVAVSFTRPELYPITLFAASKIGVSLVFAGFDDATNVTPKPDRLLTDDRMPIAQRKGALVMDQTWFAPRPSGPASRLAKTGNVVFVFGTSGSSGRRKFVRIGEANLINRLSSYEIYIDGDTRLMCTIGMGLLASIETCLTTLLFGGSIVMPPGNRQSLAHYIDLFQVNALQTTPLICDDLLRLQLPKDTYRALKVVAITGATAAPAVVRAVAEQISESVILSYGSTELGGTARFRYNERDYVPGIVGTIVAGIDVEIVDGQGQPAENGTEGLVRLRREDALVEYGYANVDEDSGQWFVGGWFYPGDRGWMDKQGNLVIAGRADDVINAGGNKYGIDLIESEIEAKLGCACVVLRGDGPEAGVYLRIVVQSGTEVRAKPLVDFVQKRFKRVGVERIDTVESIAKTETGKKDRLAMARLFEERPEAFGSIFKL